jgi:hypothetical protein
MGARGNFFIKYIKRTSENPRDMSKALALIGIAALGVYAQGMPVHAHQAIRRHRRGRFLRQRSS